MNRMAQPDSMTRRRPALCAAAGVACVLLFHAGIVAAQTPVPQPAPPPAENPTAVPAQRPGFINEFGTWLQQGVTTMGAGFGAVVGTLGGQANQAAKGATDATSTIAKGAADVARDTATTVGKLQTSSFISGRERCILAPNGAPDCRVAAQAMCRAKGYGSGAIIDFETAENCPPPYRVSSRNTPEGVCTMEHFVTRALCQ
jgi:hypothetical protein